MTALSQKFNSHLPLEYLKGLYASSPRGILLTNDKGEILYWNQNSYNLLALSLQDTNHSYNIIDNPIFNHIENVEHFHIRLEQIYKSQANTKLRIKSKDNRTLEINIRWHKIVENFTCYWEIQDISENIKKIEYLQNIKERYEATLQLLEDGVWDWNIQTGNLYVPPRWWKHLGHNNKSINKEKTNIGLEVFWEQNHLENRLLLNQSLQNHLESNDDFFEVDFQLPAKDASRSDMWLHLRGITFRNSERKAMRMVGSISDKTKQKSLIEGKNEAFLYDATTKLPGPDLLNKKLEEIIHEQFSKEKNNNDSYSLLYISFNRMNQIQENLGSNYTSKLIQIMSERIIALIHSTDLLAIISKKRLALLIKNIKNKEELKNLGQHILTSLEQSVNVGTYTFTVGCRIGATLATSGYTNVDQILQDAETSLRYAKEKNTTLNIISQGTSSKKKNLKVIYIDNLIQKSLHNDQFTSYYQPIVDIRTGRITKCEALLRHKSRKDYNPAEIINVAEQSGQIRKITKLTFQNACDFIKLLEENSINDIQVKINLSPSEFYKEDFCHEIEELFEKNNIKPKQIGLEITENVLIQYNTNIEEKFIHLKNLGIHISIDDFGTGYSNLSILKNLPIDIIKLDISFLQDMLKSKKNTTLIASVIVLGHSLGLKVIAEGVESEEHLRFLQHFECDYVQGYLFSPALSKKEFVSYLQSTKAKQNAMGVNKDTNTILSSFYSS